MIAWRVCKAHFDPWDGTGAMLRGGRWHSAGHPLLYAADSYAGALLEILAHLAEPRRLPGAHHAVRLDIPDDVLEQAVAAVPDGWERRETGAARTFGDHWLAARRTAALVVPALPSRPIGRVILVNPAHPDAARISRGEPFPVPWDERLF